MRSEGVKEQSKKHGYLLSLLGVRQFAVVVNKMDLVGYRQDVFDGIEKEYREFLGQFEVVPERIIPVSAKLGDNIAKRSQDMPWYHGPTVLETLEPLQEGDGAIRAAAALSRSGRLQIRCQADSSPDASRPDGSKSATILCSLRPINGQHQDRSRRSTSNRCSTGAVAGNRSASRWTNRSLSSGEKSPRIRRQLPLVSTAFKANLFWLGKRPLEQGRKYLLRVATREVECEVAAIHRIIDTMDLSQQQGSKHGQLATKSPN